MTGQAGEGLHRDDHQRGADRDRHRQSTEQCQRGNHQEPATGADHPGDQTNHQTLDHDLDHGHVMRCGRTLPGGVLLTSAQHGDRGRDHHGREAEEQHTSGNEVRQDPARVGAGHAGDAEDQPGPPLHAAGPRMRDRRHRTGRPDDEQRRSDGLLGIHPRHVGQQRNGENRPSAAEQPERDADQQGQDDGEGDHVRLTPGR